MYEDLLYVVTNNGVLSAYDAKTGERVVPGARGGEGRRLQRVAGRRRRQDLPAPSEDGDVFVVKAGRKPEWLATNPMGEVLMATPAISDGVLFVRGMSHLFAIGAK